jgi:hypothetical protein
MSRAPALWLALSLCASGCGGNDDDHGGGIGDPAADEYFYDCEDASKPGDLTVFATDEAFREFINKEAAAPPMKSDTLAPRLTAPMPPIKLSAAAPPLLTFALTQSAARPAAPTLLRRPARWPGLRVWLWSLVEGTAQAHCAAVSGDLYLVRLVDKDTTVYTALTAVRSFTPGAAAWKKALDGRIDHGITITVERAVFSTGSITQGPYLATSAPTFTVGP